MKESFYFSHDYNARNDQKVLMLRGKFGNEGYALFFYVLETMAEESLGYIYRGAIGGLSVGYGVATNTLIAFIDYCLEINILQEDKNGIYSRRMQEHKDHRKLLSDKGREGSKKRWKEAKLIAPPLAYKGKERKGKEIKGNINIVTNVTEQAQVIEKTEYGNKEINEMLLALKGKVGVSAFVDSSIERNMAKHCVNLMQNLGKDEFVRRLDCLLKDSFHQKNCNKIKYIYNNIKGFIEDKSMKGKSVFIS